ncbi:MAG: DUF3299 domain-containing protein [Alphaproteobacteria bacterium]|nr:DUF3299 domain-containing protein [Alphaproteobacteria bacterium]
MSKPLVVAAGLAIALSLVGSIPAWAEAPRELKWADLVPKTAAAAKRQLKTFFGPPRGASPDAPQENQAYLDSYDIRSRPEDVAGAPPPRMPEGKFMSRPVKKTSEDPPELKSELDGQRVRIGGYVVPLDFKATKITEFLLVPFVGACIHVPPPPPNQIVYVKSEDGFAVKGEFDPVYVTGTLSAKLTPTGLAETGYTIEAEAVEGR